jgi:two-component system chemotaxis response regulator CheB
MHTIDQPQRPDHPDIIAIGASAGGVEAISQLLALLPGDLPASVLVVLHRSIEHKSRFHQILESKGKMRVVIARDGEPLRHGVCYLGEPTMHLTVAAHSRIHLLANGSYSTHCIDALFCSLAQHAGQRTIGVILSGTLRDGSLGLQAVKEAGGITLVQSPAEAAYAQMPVNAIRYDGPVDLIASIGELATEICRLTGYRLQPEKPSTETA